MQQATRATFQITFSGAPAVQEQATAQLAELLPEAGYSFDEDFTTLHGSDWTVTGLVLRTEGAIRTALDVLDVVNAYLIETNPELVD